MTEEEVVNRGVQDENSPEECKNLNYCWDCFTTQLDDVVQSTVAENQEQYDTIEFELVDFDSEGNVVKLDQVEEIEGKLCVFVSFGRDTTF